MADKLHFSLVSPEREIFSGEVDQVVAPGVEGEFGVLSGHAPFMTVLKLGEVVVLNGSEKRVFEIQGGFADVTPQGLTILAEHALEYGQGVHDGGPARQPEGVGPPRH